MQREANPLLKEKSSSNEDTEYQKVLEKEAKIDWALQIYLLFEDPYSSKAAKIVSFIIISLIFMSIAIIIWSSVREIREAIDENIWLAFEVVITFTFTVEYIVRLCVCHKGGKTRWQFVSNLINICDLLSILPLYIDVIIKPNINIKILRILRMLRVIRLIKLGKYSNSLKLFWTVMYRSREPLSIFFSMLGLSIVFFASLVYLFEQGEYNEADKKYYLSNGQETLYSSIPASLWWAIVTMATVGYGDMFPKTFMGKVIGAFCVIAGIFVIVLPVGIVTNEFNRVYEEFKQENLMKRNIQQAENQENKPGYNPEDLIQEKFEEKLDLSFDYNQNSTNLDVNDVKVLVQTLENYEKATQELKNFILKLQK